MKFVLLALVVVLAMIATVTAAPLGEDQYQFLFSRFIQQYNKSYETNDMFSRYNTFKSNMNKIIAHNASGQTWTMAVNSFADQSEVEFMTVMGFKPVLSKGQQKTQQPCGAAKVAKFNFDEIDWRTKNVVSKVKDQASCGSCWAFSTVASIESAVFQKTGQMEDYSEQQLVDCSGSTGNEGCNGGLMDSAMDYIIANGGLCNTSDYAYTARDGACKKCTPAVKLAGYDYAGSGVEGLAKTLQQGPVSIALAATSAFQFYSSGVFTQCSSTSLNHALLLAGVVKSGTLGLDRDAFIIKNSWGASWGQKGFIYLDASVENCLGMAVTSAKWNVFPKLA